MKSHKPVALAQLMRDPAGVCAALLQQSQRLLRLTHTVQQYLPEPLNRHCLVANTQDDVLILITDSPVWSSRLRFHAPTLLRELQRRHALPFKSVRVKVNPPEPARQAVINERPHLSIATATLLNEVASTLDDAGLSAALRRLARHSKKRSRNL